MNLHAPSGNDDGCGQRMTVMDDKIEALVQSLVDHPELMLRAMREDENILNLVHAMAMDHKQHDLDDAFAAYAQRQIEGEQE